MIFLIDSAIRLCVCVLRSEIREVQRAIPVFRSSQCQFGHRGLLSRRRQKRQVTGRGSASRANARDLREISPFGGNDNSVFFAIFAFLRLSSGHALRESVPIGCGFAPWDGYSFAVTWAPPNAS